jgi:hypothetical protein
MYALVKRALIGATAVALAGATSAQAQVGLTSNGPVTVQLNATRSTSITLSTDVATASLASITDNSTANNFSGVNVSTSWALTSGTTLDLVGWFSTPAQALANGTNFIPSSRVEGRVGVNPYTAFTNAAVGTVGQAGGSLTLYSQSVTGANVSGLRSDPLDIRLNLTSFSTIAGSYTGTLNLQAIVQ